MAHLSMASPLGDLTLFEEGGALVSLDWGRAPDRGGPPLLLLYDARDQLSAYFEGRLKIFDLPLAPWGTTFQKAVWDSMRAIPYGETRTYKSIAEDLKSGPRAVGGGCARNPLPILIPCHRVLGSHGGLGGYSGGDGVATKRALLRLEGAPEIKDTRS